MNSHSAFETKRTNVFYINHDMAEEVQKYLTRNKTRLSLFEPLRDSEYYTLANIKERIDASVSDQKHAKGVSFVVTLKDSQEIIAVINFTNFIFGVFQACYLGFSIDEKYEGKGIMYEVLSSALIYIRDTYSLHRVMANHLPDNKKSAFLLKKLGFVQEGYAKSYLMINGIWQDHVLNALIFENA